VTAWSCPGSSTLTVTPGRRSFATSLRLDLAHYFTGLHGTLSGLYRPQDTYAANLIGTLEALDSGITTLLDWSHNLNTPEHTDAAIDALIESRSRVVFGHGGGHRHWQPVSSLAHPARTSAACARGA